MTNDSPLVLYGTTAAGNLVPLLANPNGSLVAKAAPVPIGVRLENFGISILKGWIFRDNYIASMCSSTFSVVVAIEKGFYCSLDNANSFVPSDFDDSYLYCYGLVSFNWSSLSGFISLCEKGKLQISTNHGLTWSTTDIETLLAMLESYNSELGLARLSSEASDYSIKIKLYWFKFY